MTRADSLVGKIEETIRLASQLGENAFDMVDGRGLHSMRLDIISRIISLTAENDRLRAERLTLARYSINYASAPWSVHHLPAHDLGDAMALRDAVLAESLSSPPSRHEALP